MPVTHAASGEPTRHRLRPLVAPIAALALLVAGCDVNRVPEAWVHEVDSARRSLMESVDLPPHRSFAFIALHCRADGGLLVEFEQRGVVAADGPVHAGRRPSDPPDRWEPSSPTEFFAIHPEVACPR